MQATPQCVWAVRALLGEGPVWSSDEHCVWFVDIKSQLIHRFDPLSGDKRSWAAPAQVGFVLPLERGGFVAGLATGLHHFDPASGGFRLLATVESPSLGNRLNDGCVDGQGRLWFGSMHDAETELSGSLYAMHANTRLQRMDAGYCVTNGPAVSPDGRTLYHTDTLARVIHAFDLAPDGSISNKREFARTSGDQGYPDGPIVDSEGCVWSGLYGGWGLVRYSPQGEWLEKLALPCANVTKAAFGGDDLRTLYITTARKGLDDAALEAQPLAGGLFAFEVATPGLAQPRVRLDRN